MSSRSRRRNFDTEGQGVNRLMQNAVFWQQVLTAIEIAEKDHTSLSWSGRSLLVTRFGGRLPDICERHGLGVADGYIAAIQQLVNGRQLDWFELDAIKKLKKLISEIIGAEQAMRGRSLASSFGF